MNDTLRRKIPSQQYPKVALKATNLHAVQVPAITKLFEPFLRFPR
jgi:hypothetical protein